MRARLFLFLLVSTSLACRALFPPPGATPAPRPTDSGPEVNRRLLPGQATPVPTLALTPTADSVAYLPIEGVRVCDYVPDVSVPAAMPETVLVTAPTPYPPPPLPPNTPVDSATIEGQLRVYQALWDTVNTKYVYADFNGHDWAAIGQEYKALVEGGLSDDDFYYAMNLMLYELGDDHSFFESPQEVREEEAAYAGESDYVGVGIMVDPLPEAGRAVILFTFPDSPAVEAGLRAHDSIVAVDGKSPLDADGYLDDSTLRGPEGTQVALTIERPGEAPFDLTLTRRRVSGALPVDYCVVPGTRVAYIFIPGLDDRTVSGQMREALEKLTASGPLDGVVLDNRQNYGGASTVLADVLGFFTEGTVGRFVSHKRSHPLTIQAEDVGGSQTVPLVVLVDVDTASFGEVMSGVLQNQGRATVVGQTTLGNVETLWGYDFEDGSRAWIAHETFQPENLPNGIWEETGITPDVTVPTRWDLFTEATDPALAVAVELLSK